MITTRKAPARHRNGPKRHLRVSIMGTCRMCLWVCRTWSLKIDELRGKIVNLRNYLSDHTHKMRFRSAKRAGYHFGSGAIESLNKFISNTRLKRSGAWCYIDNANNMLKIRCAKYNGTYDRIVKKYKAADQERIRSKLSKRKLRLVK